MQQEKKTNADSTNTNQHIVNNEIDLFKIINTFWEGRKTIMIITLAGAIIGLLTAILTPNQYTAWTSMVPQTSNIKSNNFSSISGLASMAGIEIGNNNTSSELSPVIYPQIINSASFQLDLMNMPIRFKDNDEPLSLYTYYTEKKKKEPLVLLKKYTIGLPGVILNSIKGEQKKNKLSIRDKNHPIETTLKEDKIRRLIANSLTLEVKQKEGYLILQSSLPEAEAAADLTQHALFLLQKYITQIKIEKATDNLNFIKDRYIEKKKVFEETQMNLAHYRDQNKNIISAIVRNDQEKLQGEYNIAYSVYSELAKQLEQAEIKVKEDTPVFSIISPIVVPLKSSKPNRKLIIITWIFLTGFIGIVWVFSKNIFFNIKKEIKKNEKAKNE